LILVVVMSAIVVALASYVTVGLRTSDVASGRTESNADSANVMNWAIEQFAKKQLRPDDSCGDAPTYLTIPVPIGLLLNGSTTTLVCAQTNPIAGEPIVHLVATSTGVQTRVVEATIEVPRYTHGARVADWRVDIPIAVPAYVTTTTGPPAVTTTTVLGNVPPTANATAWTVNPSTTTTLMLNAADSDGYIDVVSISGLPTGWSYTWSGNFVNLTVDGTEGIFNLTYTVTDDDGADSTPPAPLTVEVSASATTTTTIAPTTTTLAPNLDCVFEVTTNANGGNSGSGTLSLTNTGGPLSGWTVELTQLDSTKPWAFTWDVAVSATVGPSLVTVSGAQTIGANETFNVNAALQQTNGQPKIDAGQTLTCTVVSP
jgi:hypothetical protein